MHQILSQKALEALNKKNFVEAALIEINLVETSVRGLIRCLAVVRGIDKNKARIYWDEPMTRFSDLIKYYELLGGKVETVKNLSDFNQGRNNLVHKMVTMENYQELLGKSLENYSVGRFLDEKLISEIKELNPIFT